MIAILILALLSLSLVSLSSAIIYQTMTVQNTTQKAIQNTNDLNTIKKALILSSKNDLTYGTVMPYGINDLSFHKLPEFVYLKTKNQFGRDYIYCPFAVNQTTLNKEVKLTDSVNYMVDTANIVHRGTNREYVISSHTSQFHALGVQAIIISPTPPFSNNTSCLNVQYNTQLQVFTVEGGRVEVITTNDILIGI